MIIIYYILTIFQLILLARILVSWFPNIDRYNPIIRLLYDVTEPVLRPIRQALPQTYGFDFSPLIVFIAISLIQQLLR